MPFRNDAVNATVIGTEASTIADGADVAEGATTDAAVTSSVAGTVSGKLRGLVAWAYGRMPASLGQNLAAASLPVVLASDDTVETSVADGQNVAVGATTDAAVATSATGSLSAKLRGLIAIFTGTGNGGMVQGPVASGVASAGNPVFAGFVYNSTLDTYTTGQRTQGQTDSRGNVNVNIRGSGATTGVNVQTPGEGMSVSNAALNVNAMLDMYNGASMDRVRTVTTFKTATATASGDTAVWTPTSGKKFRLLRYGIYITGQSTLAGAASLEVLLRDATTATGLGWSVFVPAIAITDQFGYFSGWITIDNGVLSAAANNVLNVNLSAALTAGEVRVVAVGTEE